MLLPIAACGPKDEPAETTGDKVTESAGESESMPKESEELPGTGEAPTETGEDPGTVTDEPATGDESGSDPEMPKTTEPADTGTEPGKTPDQPKTPENLSLIEDGRPVYTIVVENINANYTDAVTTFRTEFRAKSGMTFGYRVLREGTVRSDKEIVIGKTLDEVVAVVGKDKIAALSGRNFYIGTKGEKVYIAVNSADAVGAALSYLSDQYYNASAKTMNLPRNMAAKMVDAIQDVVKSLNVDRVTIKIPGLKNTYTFMHISDVHAVVYDENEDSFTIDYEGKRNTITYLRDREKYFYIDGFHSRERLLAYIAYANQLNVDALFLSGDIIDAPTAKSIEYLKNALGQLKTKYVYVLGNHDWEWPGTLYWSEQYQKEFIPKFSDVSGSGTTRFQSLEFEDLVIVGMDNSMDRFYSDQVAALKDVYNTGKPVLMVMHVPLSAPTLAADLVKHRGSNIAIGTSDGATFRGEATGEFLNMVNQADTPVKAIFAGHIHMFHVDRINSTTVQYVSDTSSNGYCRLITVTG